MGFEPSRKFDASRARVKPDTQVPLCGRVEKRPFFVVLAFQKKGYDILYSVISRYLRLKMSPGLVWVQNIVVKIAYFWCYCLFEMQVETTSRTC